MNGVKLLLFDFLFVRLFFSVALIWQDSVLLWTWLCLLARLGCDRVLRYIQ